MKQKNFKISQGNFEQLVPPMGSCIASDMITVEGLQVGYMYKCEPDFETDGGWRFFCGRESQDYIDNAENLNFYDVNTIANYDRAIIPYLHLPVGSSLERISNSDKFELIVE